MTDRLEPSRLVHDLTVDPTLRDDLARAGAPTIEYDAELGFAAFEARLSSSGTSSFPTVGALLVALALLAGGGFVGWKMMPKQDDVVSAKASLAGLGQAVDLGDTNADRVVRIAWTAPTSQPVVPGEDAVERDIDEAPRVDTGDDSAREAAHLQATRRALESDPARALRLAEAGHRRFKGGTLGQEREGLAILALVEMGRIVEARSRASRFLAQFPQGTVSSRVRKALEAASGEP